MSEYKKKKPTSPLYSETYLRDRYIKRRMTPEEIAKEVGKPVMQVYRWLDRFGLRNK